MDVSQLRDEFRGEAADQLRRLTTQLLALERNPADPQAIRQMFLAAHMIKGGAAMVGLDQVCGLAHAMEDVLTQLRDGHATMDAAIADLFLRAVDTLDLMMQGADDAGGTTGGEAAGLIAAFGTCVANAQPVAKIEAAIPAPGVEPPHALLAEDSATIRLLEEMLLSDAGFAVDVVADGEQALRKLQSSSYDLLVTGAQPHTLCGLDLVARIRQDAPDLDLPVIVMSSDEQPETRQRARDLGVSHYLIRGSLSQQVLVEVARAVANRKRV